MINDVMILPCIRELENSLCLGAPVTSPLCCSCSPNTRGALARCSWGHREGPQSWGLGQSQELSPVPALSWVGDRAAALPSLLIFVPPSPGTAFPTQCEWHRCPFTLSVPRCHSRAAGSHLMHRVVFGGSGEGNPLYPRIHGISDRILSQGRAEGEGMELRVQEGSLPS